MRLLVYEFITGGGLIGAPIPRTLLREGAMMRDALLADLTGLPGIALSLTRDARCTWPPTEMPVHRIEPNDGEAGIALYRRALTDVDAVWPIAPESDQALQRLELIARSAGKKVMLSDAATLALCASKFETARALNSARVNVVPTYRTPGELFGHRGKFVSKPDAGSGGAGIRLWRNSSAAFQALSAQSQSPQVFQPWCDGESLSLSLLCADGVASLLSINRQHIAWQDDCVMLQGITVNAYRRDAANFQALSRQIAQALPGLWGYIGVDLIRAKDGALTVLEINPRLTTSYCGLCDAVGINVAELLLSRESLALGDRVIDRAVYLDLKIADV